RTGVFPVARCGTWPRQTSATSSTSGPASQACDQVEVATRAEESPTKSMGQKVTFRTREQVLRFFSGLDLVDPGVVAIQDWRPESILDLHSPPPPMRRRGPQELPRRPRGSTPRRAAAG